MGYNDYFVFRTDYICRKIHAPDEVPDSGKVAVKRVGNVMEVDDAVMKELFEESMKKHNEAYKNYWKMVREQEYKVDEEVMKKRFEDWMKEYGRTYKNEKEKARRYEAFKVNAINTDKLNAHSLGDARNRLNEYADWTEDEFRSMDCRHGDMDMKSYIEDTRTMYAEGRFGARPRKVTVTEPPS
ncbi:trophozoite cysteine proteinase-like [Panicum virgatum]|nr:trophozoite cysteine proteinase-like [Panicum virgatum]